MTTPPVELTSRMDYVYRVVADVVGKHLYTPLTGSVSMSTLDYLLHATVENRYYLIRDLAGLEREWNRLRTIESVVDFLLSVTVELRVRLDMSPVPLTEVIAALSTAFGQFRGENSTIDSDLQERLPTPGTTPRNGMAALYGDNPWFVTLLLIQLSQCLRLVETGTGRPLGKE